MKIPKMSFDLLTYEREMKRSKAERNLQAFKLVFSILLLLLMFCITNITNEIVIQANMSKVEGVEAKKESNFVETTPIPEVTIVKEEVVAVVEPEIIQAALPYPEAYPESVQERKNAIYEYAKVQGQSDYEARLLSQIAYFESCIDKRFETPAMCMELQTKGGVPVIYKRNGQQVTEYAQTVFQILPSTWVGHGCAGNIYGANYMQITDCAINIKNRSGWSQWSVYNTAKNSF